ncbi:MULTISPECIES: LLM class flavin-dependent oxidoreductase [Glutamicibacter]|uniref:LLM class flavin-dependent oxidoreductase n=1 Tax=Glutamicibacter TaxID=1742989 RepID=UPI00167F8B56|nr:LLM class flavin-dependent oxidoreductase [Glutamicibacter nicotianae]
MEYWHFSEMPYPHLPDEEKYDSIRVTMPNSFVDPGTAADLMDRYITDWIVADQAGINIMVNEHHGTATCMNAAAPLVAAALSQVTEQAKILILGNPVANRKDPVRVAEEMALVDLMTRGRLEVGFVRGVPYEISATNSSPIKMNERMWEAIDLIKAAWTTHDGPFNWEGEFFQHRQVNIWPRPYTQPHPPIWVSAMSPSSVPRVADGDAVLATFLTGVEGTKKVFDSYRARWEETGKGEVPLDRFGYAALTFVGDTDAEGMAGAEQLMWYLKSNKVPQEFILPPGYTPYFARAGALQGGGSVFDLASMSMDQLMESGIMFAGSPTTVAEQMGLLKV